MKTLERTIYLESANIRSDKIECKKCGKKCTIHFVDGWPEPEPLCKHCMYMAHWSAQGKMDYQSHEAAKAEVLRRKRQAQKEKYGYSHSDLCELAVKWLRKNGYTIIAREPSDVWGDEKPDAIGWAYWGSCLIECKVTRSDFLADAKKPFRAEPETGMGNIRYYLCPEGVIRPDELPAGWGLITIKNRISTVICGRDRPGNKPDATYYSHNANKRAEIGVLLWAIRRLKEGKDII